MCRLLSISGKITDKELDFFGKKFQKQSHLGNVPAGYSNGHKDGWGVAAYEKGRLAFFAKESRDAFSSAEYGKALASLKKIKPEIIVSHLRKASVGKLELENTHPFVFGNFSFCQNGTIFGSEKIKLSKRAKKNIQGSTDSEKFFIFLMQNIKQEEKSSAAVRQAIKKSIAYLRKNFDYTAVNFILTNGKLIWVLREINEKNDLVRAKNLKDYYTLFLGKNGKGDANVVSSEAIENKNYKWKKIKNHELLEMGAGKIKAFDLT